MRKKLLAIALALILSVTLFPENVQADSGALVEDSEYWIELTFSKANQMVGDAINGEGDSFILFFYNRS